MHVLNLTCQMTGRTGDELHISGMPVPLLLVSYQSTLGSNVEFQNSLHVQTKEVYPSSDLYRTRDKLETKMKNDAV